MLVPPTEGLKVAKYASGAGYAPDQWARALAGVDWSKAELLSDKPTSSVWRAELVVQKRPMTLVIKCEPIDSLKRKVQKILHTTHAYRQWRGANLLYESGIGAADPKAVVYGRRDGAIIECLIMEALPGRSLLRHIADQDQGVREQHQIARALGGLIASMIRKRLVNADPKPSNIVVTRASGAITLGFVDTVDIKKVSGFLADNDADVWFMLRDLLLEPMGVGRPVRRALAMRVLRSLWKGSGSRSAWRAWRNEWWGGVSELVQAHGDPTPEHNPLGPASRTSPEGG